LTIALVLISNQRSRPISSVIEATIATASAGTAATSENSATMRTCSREAALPRRLAATMRCTSRPISSTSARISSTLMAISVSVTCLDGAIGPSPTRMMKETAAQISAAATATMPGKAISLRPSGAAGSSMVPAGMVSL
jgi:hypothetical protein